MLASRSVVTLLVSGLLCVKYSANAFSVAAVPATSDRRIPASWAQVTTERNNFGRGGSVSLQAASVGDNSPTDPSARSRLKRPLVGIVLLLVADAIRGSVLPTGPPSTAVPLRALLVKYNACMTAHPLQTKVLTGGVLAVLGDALAQSRDENPVYDRKRAASFATFDMFYRMFQHRTFPFITALCKGTFLASILSSMASVFGHNGSLGMGLTQFLAAFERTMTYQLVVVPLLYYPIFFSFTGLMQGLSLKETFLRAKDNFLQCWGRNLLFWVPTQMVMFGLISENWQVPFVCAMGIIWSMILSATAGKASAGEACNKEVCTVD